jgi:hypothetical protein
MSENVIPLKSTQAGAGDFFAVDRWAWAHVCGLGLNAAVSYLVLASGTGGDNRTTAWSVNAIEKYTSIGRWRARAALKDLEQAGCIRTAKAGTRPRYEIVAAADIRSCKNAQPDPEWIWLPNAIVTGAADETPPVELIRQSQNVGALRLFVDLYISQSLAADGGVDWRQLKREHGRIKVGEYGPYVIFGFEGASDTACVWRQAPFLEPHLTGKSRGTGFQVFWNALEVLTSTGLIEIVQHLVESDKPEAEIIHPYATMASGLPQERELARSAHRAGLSIMRSYSREPSNPSLWLVPVLAHLAGVQLVGVFRMLYRPRTRATTAWFMKHAEWQDWQRRYEELARKHGGQVEETAKVS